MSFPLFDPRILRPLVDYLEDNGADGQWYLDRARIPGGMIESGGWIAKKQAYDLVDDVIDREHDRSAVFAAYLDFQLGDLGPIAVAMRSCVTVKEAIEVAARLGSVAFEGNQYFLEIGSDTTWLSYRESKVISSGQRFINDMTLTVYYHLIRLTVDESWRPQQIRSHEQKTDRHLGVELFEDCKASFHRSSTGIGFPTEFLSRCTPWQKSLSEFNESDAWDLRADQDGDAVDSIYRLIASRLLYRTPPTLQAAATLVGVSPATLKRQLASSGISYRHLLDRVRYQAACEMLSCSHLTVYEIAGELGYSGTNNFGRSFRRLAGMTPGEFRRQKLSEVG
ncbi:MAG: helix-turn-helix domain-containing protein [Rubripirellula sp.]